jgi:hypothetical protein
MEANHLLDQILVILHMVKDDKEKLQKIFDFLEDEIYEEPEDIFQTPEKYKKTVSQIAENMDCGLTSFLNPETLEIEFVPQNLDAPEEYELMTGESYEDTFKHTIWKKCIIVEPPESRESFKIMERFVDEVNDKRLREDLIDALNRKRPFANFKQIVETSQFRQAWFDFKKEQLEMKAWDELESELPKEE